MDLTWIFDTFFLKCCRGLEESPNYTYAYSAFFGFRSTAWVKQGDKKDIEPV